MSKVFRIYKEGKNIYKDWNTTQSFPYNNTARQTIEDPDGATARKEITSIPSPFARIDLVKSAFREVCKPNVKTEKIDIDGDTIFHKMVSDTLDVAEIFFNIDKFKGKVEIIKWHPTEMLKELHDSNEDGHKYLADALQKYMQADATSYNFDALQNIYLLNYVKGNDMINIIGATSPATLFFSNANDLSFINDIYFADNDKPFDSAYQPLYKRDFEFIKYLFYLKNNIPNFSKNFKEVDAYLDENFKKLNDSQKDEIRNIGKGFPDSLVEIKVAGDGVYDNVEVLGHYLYKKSSVADTAQSQFKIRTQKDVPFLPLVLPVEAGNNGYDKLRYTTGIWGTTNAAPYLNDEEDLNKRELPFDGAISPYLTISDFLEDTIAKVPYTLNKDAYFNGNYNKNDSTFLLPIKPLFFDYFSVEELTGKMNDDKPMFEMIGRGNESVEVTLRIPITGDNKISYIEYSRVYYNTGNTPEIDKNKGVVKSFDFTGFVMPMLKFKDDAEAIYNVACIQPEGEKHSFAFYKENQRLSIKPSVSRHEEGASFVMSENYLIEETNFDFIQVSYKFVHGILVPKFKKQLTTNAFDFAIDLGTSNTHIEYKKSTENILKAFDITADDKQICEIFVPQKDADNNQVDLLSETELLEKDFLTSVIGNTDFSFPTRTVLSYSNKTDWKELVEPFMLANLPMTYDKRNNLDYNNYESNIKWGKGDELLMMEAYVKCIMLMIRNKVLLNNGDLKKTTIKWFYPISMAPIRQKRLKDTWNDTFKKYFGDGNTICMTESAAPIHYYFNKYPDATSLINVDIGGGTTDIAFAKDKKIQKVTSFRFASNNLFEDAYADQNNQNGIVDYYKDKFKDILQSKASSGIGELIKIFETPNNQKPSNMASFLFGLKDNSILKKAGLQTKTIDFNSCLQDDENFKVVFILYYTAIIYHIAQIVKNQGLELPRHIAFSGNGSKVIRIITTETKVLAEYTKLVFKKVTGMEFKEDLDILGLEDDSTPKEATCKGGLSGTHTDDDSDKIIVFKSDASGIVTSSDTYKNINNEYLESTVDAVKYFFSFVLNDMNKEFSFEDNFGANKSSVKLAKEFAEKDLKTFLDKGIAQRKSDADEDDVIEETFFFYPIKGVLNRLSKEINKKIKKS